MVTRGEYFLFYPPLVASDRDDFFHLASYPVDHLDIQGRGKGPLLGSRWEELLHFEEPYVVEVPQGGPCAGEEGGLGLAWACSLPLAALVVGLPQILAGGQDQGKLRSIEGPVLHASNYDTKIGHQPVKEKSDRSHQKKEAFLERNSSLTNS